jgi:hypothetical protein
MHKFLKNLVALGLVLITVESAWAQLDNRAFTLPKPGNSWHLQTLEMCFSGDSAGAAAFDTAVAVNKRQEVQENNVNAGDLRLSLRSFTFFKDNEYFNKIIEGYTLFGTQLNPQLVYYPTKNLRLEAGVFLWKDFGNPQMTVRPTYRATWTKGPHQFILGNIRPHLNHNYIEPLFNFERVMLKPLEEGLQYRLNSRRVFLDVWVDWQRQQYRYSNFQEEIAGGLSGSVLLVNNTSWQIGLPVQFTATHHGGQIDTIEKPLQTLFNGAAGLSIRRQFAGEIWQAVRFDGYALGFDDHSPEQLLPFKGGNAFYLNGTLETKYVDVMASYFQGRRFISPLGGDLYQGLSRSVSDPTYTEPNRRILILRLMRDFRIDDAAALTVRVGPVYSFQEKLWDFSAGVYLNFRQEWLLGNVGRRLRVGQ